MSRPRIDAEQKKVSFSLAFSPNLIVALEKVRGAKSQSVFVEEWLRQHPQIAASLAAMTALVVASAALATGPEWSKGNSREFGRRTIGEVD